MTTSGQNHRMPPESGRKASPKPPLGPPHDTYATLALTLAFAASLFFAGRFQGGEGRLTWVGMLACLAVAVAAVFYFQRAYGFASRGRGTVPRGSLVAGVFGFIYIQQFVPGALYQEYFHESVLVYSLTCLAVAALPVAVLRGTLGNASSPERADETAPNGPADDAETRGLPEERG